jgi:hypothetical protein
MNFQNWNSLAVPPNPVVLCCINYRQTAQFSNRLKSLSKLTTSYEQRADSPLRLKQVLSIGSQTKTGNSRQILLQQRQRRREMILTRKFWKNVVLAES